MSRGGEKPIFILFCVLLLTVSSAACRHVRKSHPVTAFISDDGSKKITVYQLGDPDFPYGNTQCRLILSVDEQTCGSFDIAVRNDGVNVCADNFRVSWEGTYASVTVSGDEQEDEIIRFGYDGRVQTEARVP